MAYFREWVQRLNSRCGNMVDVTLIPRILSRHNPGWISVYAFDEAAADCIRAASSSQGFARYVTTANTLYLDLDAGDSALEVAESLLLALGVSFTVYDSGSKGYHIEIPHQEISDPRLPYSHRHWVELSRIPADLSIYRPNSLIALPGRVHPKTGRKKQKLREVSGTLLNLNLVDVPERPTARFDFSGDMPERNCRVTALFMLADAAGQNPGPGDRHLLLWKVAKMACEGGFSEGVITELLLEINETWDNPKPEEEVINAIKQAYRSK